jgi:hypothetical protein
MSQERGPGELSAEEIAQKIGAVHAVPAQPPPVTTADAYRARLIAAQRGTTRSSVPLPEHVPEQPIPTAADRPPEPRRTLLRDTATTLLGLSAVALIVLAVWPPSPTGGVLGATATPSSPSPAATASPTPTPEPTPTLGPTPSPGS